MALAFNKPQPRQAFACGREGDGAERALAGRLNDGFIKFHGVTSSVPDLARACFFTVFQYVLALWPLWDGHGQLSIQDLSLIHI